MTTNLPRPDLWGYFDYAATEPPLREALTAYLESASRVFGNPSSAHRRGLEARRALEGARARFRSLVGASPKAELVLTSGGTEANNLVLESFLRARPDRRLLMARDVHASTWYAAAQYPDRVDVLEVDAAGRLSPAALADRLTEEHGLVSVVHGNNETGAVQDLGALAGVCTGQGALLHADGAQTVGRVPVDFGGLEGVFFTFSSHKFGAPRGNGGVIATAPAAVGPQLHGGGQEGGRRAGTEDLAAFVAAVAALEATLAGREALARRLRGFATRVVDRVLERFPQTVVNSSPEGLPGFVSLSVPGLNAAMAVTEMTLRGFDLSSGSACHAGSSEPSRVIRAMGRDRVTALGTLRITMGYGTGDEEVTALTEVLVAVIERGLEVR